MKNKKIGVIYMYTDNPEFAKAFVVHRNKMDQLQNETNNDIWSYEKLEDSNMYRVSLSGSYRSMIGFKIACKVMSGLFWIEEKTFDDRTKEIWIEKERQLVRDNYNRCVISK